MLRFNAAALPPLLSPALDPGLASCPVFASESTALEPVPARAPVESGENANAGVDDAEDVELANSSDLPRLPQLPPMPSPIPSPCACALPVLCECPLALALRLGLMLPLPLSSPNSSALALRLASPLTRAPMLRLLASLEVQGPGGVCSGTNESEPAFPFPLRSACACARADARGESRLWRAGIEKESANAGVERGERGRE